MVKIIKEYREPTLGERFAEGISRGAKEFGAKENRIKPKEPEKRPELHKTITDIASKTGIDYTPDNLLSINDQAHKYHKQGLDEFSSSVNALKDFKEGKLDREQMANQLSGQESSRKGFVGRKIDRLEQDLNRIKGKKPENEQDKALRRSEADQRKLMAREQIAKNRESAQGRGGFHSLSSLNEEQLGKISTPGGPIEARAAGATARAAASELTFGLSEKLPFDKSLHQLSEEGLGKWVTAGKVVGSLGPAHLSFGAANALLKGTGAATRYGRQLLAAGAISGHEALTQKIESGTVRPGDIGLTFAGAATLGLAFEAAAPYARSIYNFFKRSRPKISNVNLPNNVAKTDTVFNSKVGKSSASASSDLKNKSLLDLSIREASEAGVDLDALAKGNPDAVSQYQSVLRNIEQMPPSVLNEKISRMFTEAELQNITRRAQVLEDQVAYAKRVRTINEEIAEEEGRIALRDKPVTHTDAVKSRMEGIKTAARQELGAAKSRYNSVRAEIGKTKDLISYMNKTNAPIAEIEQAQQNLQRLQVLNEEAAQSVEALEYELAKGEKFTGNRQIEIERKNDLANFEHKVETRPENELLKGDIRDEYIAKTKNRRELPGTDQLKEDTHTRILRERIKGYDEKVAALKEKRLRVPDEQIKKIDKAIGIAEKLAQRNRDLLRVHNRRRATKDLSNTLQRKEKLKGTNVKREDVSNAFKQAIKDPSESNVHKLQDAVYGPENSKIINDSMDSALKKAEKIFHGPGTEKEKVKLLKEALTEEKDAIGKASSKKKSSKEKTEQTKPSGEESKGEETKEDEAGKWSIKNNFSYKIGKWLFNKQFAKTKLFVVAYIGHLLGIPTPRKLVNDMSDNRDAKRLANLSDSKASNYISDLRAKGLSPQRIKKIKAEADSINRSRSTTK